MSHDQSIDSREFEKRQVEKRDRAWRRKQRYLHKSNGVGSDSLWKDEKKWKLIYFRSKKLVRAKQLGFHYPIESNLQFLEREYFSVIE